jgi:hypothetical protein
MKKSNEIQLHNKQNQIKEKPKNDNLPNSLKAIPREQKQLYIPENLIPDHLSNIEREKLFPEWPADAELNVYFYILFIEF